MNHVSTNMDRMKVCVIHYKKGIMMDVSALERIKTCIDISIWNYIHSSCVVSIVRHVNLVNL